MAFVVEIFRKVNNKNSGIDLNIHSNVWDKLLKLGQEEGWVPMGTICPPECELKGFKNDYRPDYPDSKMVLAVDALNWANALQKAYLKMLTSPSDYKVTGPILIREDDAEPGPGVFFPDFNPEILDNFIKYISKGEFFFWWDD